MTIEAAVAAHAAGAASAEQKDWLEANPAEWAKVLRRLIFKTDDALRSALKISGPYKEQVVDDLRSERAALSDVLRERTGDEIVPIDQLARSSRSNGAAAVAKQATKPPRPAEPEVVTEPTLQASWAEGRLVLWVGGQGAPSGSAADLDRLTGELSADSIAWEKHAGVRLPSGEEAEARSAPLAHTLGWLVSLGASTDSAEVGASLRWIAGLAAWGTQMVAEGRMVPVIRSAGGGSGGRGGITRHRVRWAPALMERDRLAGFVASMPGAVAALQSNPQPDGVCRSIVASVVDAISRAGAHRLVAPATPPDATNRLDVSEAILSRLDGQPFTAAADVCGRIGDDMKRWANPVTSSSKIGVVVALDPPADDGGWLLSVSITGVDKQPLPVEHAIVVSSGAKAQQVEAQMRRLERLVPALKRPSTRRGQVVLDGEEATELMFSTGQVLAAAGFEVYFPKISRRKPTPQLRLFAEAMDGSSQVGIQQLASVRWSVVFDDVELDAAQISRLAAEAKPLVQVKGRWVHIDRADLAAAAAALAERASITRLSGAALLRHAVGLEGSDSLGGAIRVEGSGWAVDLLKGARSNPPAPVTNPEGFMGELRHYQADAVGWLGFLDRAGLGGVLAMDMGLGKTPTVLAQMRIDRGNGPVLVVCPPAVLGNWAAEARKFVPGLQVAIHHGPGRAEGEGLRRLIANSDVVLSTYGTTVRDMDQLAKIEWRRVVLDEAQAIKNHASETAQALRRLNSWSRLAMTGTPVENGLGDLWAILDFTNPGLVGNRSAFIEHLGRATGARSSAGVSTASLTGLPAPGAALSPASSADAGEAHVGLSKNRSAEEGALQALNGLLVFRRTKAEPEIAAELPDKVDKLDQCSMTAEQVGLYQAVINRLVAEPQADSSEKRRGQVLAAITALKQICDHPAAYLGDEDDQQLAGRSGKLSRLEQIVDDVFSVGEKILVFTHFARWGEKMARHLSRYTGTAVRCYHGELARGTRDQIISDFQSSEGPAALVLSIKAGGSGLNLTAANHVVLYDRWWNPAVEDQARDRAWRIGQTQTVVSHRLVCPGTVDERVEEIVAGKRRIAGLVLPARSSLGDLDPVQLQVALGLNADELIEDEPAETGGDTEEAA